MNSYYDDYDKKYPDLIMDILDYFDISNTADGNINDKSVIKFCEKYIEGNQLRYQPSIINRICKRLCDCGKLERISSIGGNGWKDNYLFITKNRKLLDSIRPNIKHYYNSIVYGFEYIYNMYKDIVIPLVCENKNGDYAVGTGFKFFDGIVTAKHCINDAANLQIKGYKAAELQDKPVYISDNDGVDIAFIETGKEEAILFTGEGEIMQDVLVMGYPKIPAFTNFLTAEKATISSKATSRITQTAGSIAAYGYEYLTNMNAMLITARIRGGNSGGPVINQYGCLVGIACHIPDTNPDNGDYDDLGYGVAVPVHYLTEIMSKKAKQLPIPDDLYRDYVE